MFSLLNKDNYVDTLYVRDSSNNIRFYNIEPKDNKDAVVKSGIVGRKGLKQTIHIVSKTIQAIIRDKRKSGYKYLSEVKDNEELPTFEELPKYLNTYLEKIKTGINGEVKPMLAKTFDNKNNKLFKKDPYYAGQMKINGLRCLISYEKEGSGFFMEDNFVFRSREGNKFTRLTKLNQKLKKVLNEETINFIKDNNIVLDGELFIPNQPVNIINHCVKDDTDILQEDLKFICYDLAIPDVDYETREQLRPSLGFYDITPSTSVTDINNKDITFFSLMDVIISSEDDAVKYRDQFISLGYEGLIIRRFDEEYQFGKRNKAMLKFKRHTDGIFRIIDIFPEGEKRPDIPLLKCVNDINSETFNCRLGGTVEYQKEVLVNKDEYIGRYLEIEYGERSGDKAVPFHIKRVKLKE